LGCWGGQSRCNVLFYRRAIKWLKRTVTNRCFGEPGQAAALRGADAPLTSIIGVTMGAVERDGHVNPICLAFVI
jgi:hypothetical protein